MHNVGAMKGRFSLTAGIALLALVAAVALPLTRSPLDLARLEAGPRRLVVVDFYTDWCGWCQVLDRAVYPDPRVRGQLNRAVFLRLDAEREGRDAALRYRVDGFPTIVFVNAGGKEVGRIRGFYPAAEFAARARTILDSSR